MGISDLGLDSNAPGMLGAVPNSFATQMAMATGGLKGFNGREGDKAEDTTEGMMGRLMLARMKTLEEGFAEVVKEFRGMRTAGNSSAENDASMPGPGPSMEAKGKGKSSGPSRKRKSDGIRTPHTTSEIDFTKIASKGKGKETESLGVQVGADMDTPERELIRRYLEQGRSL